MKRYNADIETNYTIYANSHKDEEITKSLILMWRDNLISQYKTTIEPDNVMALFNIPESQRQRIEERAYVIKEGQSYLHDTGRYSIIYHLTLTIENPIEESDKEIENEKELETFSADTTESVGNDSHVEFDTCNDTPEKVEGDVIYTPPVINE